MVAKWLLDNKQLWREKDDPVVLTSQVQFFFTHSQPALRSAINIMSNHYANKMKPISSRFRK
jgi:hypothetical protein